MDFSLTSIRKSREFSIKGISSAKWSEVLVVHTMMLFPLKRNKNPAAAVAHPLLLVFIYGSAFSAAQRMRRGPIVTESREASMSWNIRVRAVTDYNEWIVAQYGRHRDGRYRTALGLLPLWGHSAKRWILKEVGNAIRSGLCQPAKNPWVWFYNPRSGYKRQAKNLQLDTE